MSFISINGYEIGTDCNGHYTIDGKPCGKYVTMEEIIKALQVMPLKELERTHEAYSEERAESKPIEQTGLK